jgi:hypothetical protein
MNKTAINFPLLTFIFLLSLSHYSFGDDKVESQVYDDIDWKLTLPQEILQGTQCTISEEERLFIESFFS